MNTFLRTKDEQEKHSFKNGQGILAKNLPFLDVTFSKMKPGLVQEKMSYYARCAFILEVVIDENKINKLNFCLAEKQNHVMPLYQRTPMVN